MKPRLFALVLSSLLSTGFGAALLAGCSRSAPPSPDAVTISLEDSGVAVEAGLDRAEISPTEPVRAQLRVRAQAGSLIEFAEDAPVGWRVMSHGRNAPTLDAQGRATRSAWWVLSPGPGVLAGTTPLSLPACVVTLPDARVVRLAPAEISVRVRSALADADTGELEPLPADEARARSITPLWFAACAGVLGAGGLALAIVLRRRVSHRLFSPSPIAALDAALAGPASAESLLTEAWNALARVPDSDGPPTADSARGVALADLRARLEQARFAGVSVDTEHARELAHQVRAAILDTASTGVVNPFQSTIAPTRGAA